MKPQRYVVHYAGQVQGVGFRYTVCRLAKSFEVSGYVRNLADGCVQLVAEGQVAELDRFLQAICEEMSGYIRKQQTDYQEPTGEFTNFGLRW